MSEDSTRTGLADQVIEGQQYLRWMRTSAGLREAAEALATSADQIGCRSLFPASAEAQAVASVAVALHETLRTITLEEIASERIDKVVVVEAVAVTGFRVRRAVEAVRCAGAHWVSALVLQAAGAGEGDLDRFGPVDQFAAAG